MDILVRLALAGQPLPEGYTSGEATCETLAAVKDLVMCSTLDAMDTDAVTILDFMPFMEEDFDGNVTLHTKSHEVFTNSLIAKQPSVIMSCFSSESSKGFLSLLRHEGVGTKQDGNSLPLPGARHTFTTVNAFHPSFADNYHPYESCFRRLLILQFAKAFAICWSDWEEKPSMID